MVSVGNPTIAGFFGRLWDKIVAREAAISNSPPGK